MLKRKSKRVLSIVLAVAMIVGLFPVAAVANEGDETSTVATSLPPAVEDVITLEKDITLSSDVTLDQDVSINLNGYNISTSGSITITGNVTLYDSTAVTEPVISEDYESVTYKSGKIDSNTSATSIRVTNGGSFTIESGTIESDGTAVYAIGNTAADNRTAINSSVIMNGGYIHAQEYGMGVQGLGATATMNNGVIMTNDNAVIGGNGTKTATEDLGGTTINISGGTMIGHITTPGYIACGIYHPQEGQLNISGGTIYADRGVGVLMRAGDANISGGQIIATGKVTGQVGDSKIVVGSYGVVFDDRSGYPGKQENDTVLISDEANVSGEVGAVTVVGEEGASPNNDRIEITGGTFSSNVSDFVADGNKYENGQVVIDETKAVASVNGVGYTSLQDAITAAPADGTVTLVRDFTLNAPDDLSDGQGAVLIAKNITIDGNNKTITAGTGFDVKKNDQGKISRGKYHVFNIQNAGNVVIKDLTIEGKSVANDSIPRSGINVWSPTSATALTVENVTVNNCSTYGLTASGKDVDVVLNGLTTNGNAWGGVNIDTKNEGDVALTVNDADLNEVSSIVFDKGDGATKDPVATINGGNFENLVVNEGAESTKLLINGGTFNPDADEPSGGTAVDIEKHLAPGLEYNPWTGEVYKEPEYTGKYSYEIFTKVGENGTISVDRYATEGDDVTITVSPDEAYLLDELTVTTGGKEVEVKDNGDGTYTFKMPSADAKIVVTFAEDPDWEPEPEEPAMPFTDVNDNDWFYDVVLYAYDNGLMTGVSATEFAPNQTTTRGMIVSMLARLEGVTSAEDAGFADVAANDWYATAVNWAASVGVVNGYEDNTFRPNAPITREQMAAILYNYADYKGYDVSARADLSDYADAASISSWAEDVLAWANAEGLINGMTATTIDPQGATTRAQTAAMFERFLTAHEA